MSFLSILALAGLLAGVWGCDPGPRPPGRDGGTTTDGEIPSGSCTPGSPGVICNGNEAVTCLEDGSEGGRTNCASMGQVCVSGSGCATCRPGSFQCNGNDVEQCN
ncbi:MAG TPA: hypothetical protein RMH99_11640, partial [Sandaracinaceae bacterium LLY-WYZ-13_1]|nr:hypothetical protein [Sandaracinaceae bacterium LLY-WYZ-13_1]